MLDRGGTQPSGKGKNQIDEKHGGELASRNEGQQRTEFRAKGGEIKGKMSVEREINKEQKEAQPEAKRKRRSGELPSILPIARINGYRKVTRIDITPTTVKKALNERMTPTKMGENKISKTHVNQLI